MNERFCEMFRLHRVFVALLLLTLLLPAEGAEPSSAAGMSVTGDAFNGSGTIINSTAVYGSAVVSSPLTVTSPGLLSWWKADGNANDSVGPENGTAQGGLEYVPGVQGLAFRFNGTDAAVNLPTTSLPSYPNPWSIAAWVSTTATDERYILFYGNGQDWMSNAVSLGMLNGNLMTTQGGDNLNSGFIADGALHYVAVTFDGTSHRLYVDGQLVGTRAMATVSSPVSYAAIGRSILNIQPQYGNPSFWSGLVDDLQLYNRDLSGPEIAAAYAAVNAATVLATDPVLTSVPGTTAGFPASPYPYASTAITVDPYPPTQGQAVTLGALLQNPTNAAITLASVDFAVSGYGLGLTWQPVGSVPNVTIPATGIVNGTTTPGTAHPTLQWTPPFSGHHCVQVILHYADGSVQVLQRNIDIIGFSGGGPVSTTFQVGDPVGAGTVTLKVVPVDQSPSGWTATLDQSSLTLAAGQLQNVNLTITPPAGAPNGSFAIYNVEGYVGSTLIGGISKRVEISSGVQTPAQLTLASTMPSGGTVAGTPPNVTVPTFTASLTGGSPTSGVPVAFAVTGANPQTKTVSMDSTGTATFSYTGTKAGADTIVASVTINGTTVTSNPLTVTWGVPAPIITNLVPGGYVPGGRSTITGHTVSSGHIRCTHHNGTDVWETDADADGNWSLAIDLSGDGDGEDILYIEDGSGGGYFHIYAGGGGGFRIIVDSTGGGADFHVTGSAGGGVNNVYLGDAGVGIAAILGGGSASDSYKIYWSASGDDTVDWTEVDSGPCGCIPDGGITFHRVGSRTLSYYIVDRYGHRGPTRQRVIRNKAPMAISNVAVTPGTFSTATTTVTGGTGQRATVTYTLS